MYNKQAQMKNSFILYTQLCALWQNESLGNIVKAPDIQDTLQCHPHHHNYVLCIYMHIIYIAKPRYYS